MRRTGTSSPHLWAWSPLWALVGASWVLSIVGAPSFGIFIAAFALVGTLALTLSKRSRGTFPGLLSGCGLPLLIGAYFNRSGPGTVCTGPGTGPLFVEACQHESDPIIWLATGIFLVVAGIAVLMALTLPEKADRAR